MFTRQELIDNQIDPVHIFSMNIELTNSFASVPRNPASVKLKNAKESILDEWKRKSRQERRRVRYQ